MHSSRMRTARSLTISHSICHAHPHHARPLPCMHPPPCTPPGMHAPLPHMPPMHPPPHTPPPPCMPPLPHMFPPVDRILDTLLKILPCPNSVAGGNNTVLPRAAYYIVSVRQRSSGMVIFSVVCLFTPPPLPCKGPWPWYLPSYLGP